MLPPTVKAEYCAHFPLHLIDGTNAGRAPGGAFLVRKVDRKAVGIGILNLRLGKGLVRPIAKARQVPSEHVVLGLALDHPLRRQQA